MPLILLVLGALGVTAVSRRLRLPAPLMLVVSGRRLGLPRRVMTVLSRTLHELDLEEAMLSR